MTGVRATMPELATVRTKPLQRKVVDETGLTGAYDFKLHWAPDSGSTPANEGVVTDLPSIFTALQEQLGLRLRDSKGPVEVLVIDGAEKPSAN